MATNEQGAAGGAGGKKKTRADERTRLAGALAALPTIAERMRFVQEHTTRLGTAGLDAVADEIGRLEGEGTTRARRRGYRAGNAPARQGVGNLILTGLTNYLYLGEHHDRAVRLAFRLLRCADVSDASLRQLFHTNIGRSACCVDHYGRVDVALDELEAGGLSDDGSLEAYATCLMAKGLLRDNDVAPASGTEASAALRGAVAERDTEALLRVRGRVLARLADLAESGPWRDEASSIALGYVGCREVDEGLVAATHALVAPNLARLARLDTYDGCFDAALFLWGCRKSGIDAGALSKALSPSPAQSLALAVTRAICDRHERDLARGELGAPGGDVPSAGIDDALHTARTLSLEDWGEFALLVKEISPTDRYGTSGNELERVILSRRMVGEVCSRLLEERAGGQELLDHVLATALTATPSRSYRNGTPIVAYLYDRCGYEDACRRLERHVRSERGWWLSRFGELAAARQLDHDTAAILASLDDRRELLDFGTVCASQRLVGGSFVVEYLPRVCARIDKGRGRSYPGIPDDVEEFRRMTDGVFVDDDSKDMLAWLVVGLVGGPDMPSDKVIAEVLRMCPSALGRMLSVGNRRLSAAAFARIAIKAYTEANALAVVEAQVEATHRGDLNARRLVYGLESELISREVRRPNRRRR